jgi:O-antigen ligase
LAYVFFILLNGILFIRPGDLFEALEPLALYQLMILGCLATTYTELLGQVRGDTLVKRPLTICVLGMLAAVILSHMQFGSIYDARTSGFEFFKNVIYFLLLLCNLDTPKKYQRFLDYLVMFTLVASGLALLQYYGLIDLPAMAAYEQREIDEITGEVTTFARLCGAGMFNDPNDVCLMLSIAMLVCIYRATTPGGGTRRFFWLAPFVVFLLAFIETKSRGGFLSLMVGLNVLLVSRLGLRKSIPIWMLGVPVVLVVFGGRMTNIEVEGGTGQHRIQLWREALELVREYPLFGVGQGMITEHMPLVAHNSYIHAFAELGIFGGTCFVSSIFLAVSQLFAIRKTELYVEDPEMRRLHPYILGIVCGFFSGVIFLSRVYIEPTYMVLGMAGAYLQQVTVKPDAKRPLWEFDSALFARLAVIGITTLLALEIGSRLMVRWD